MHNQILADNKNILWQGKSFKKRLIRISIWLLLIMIGVISAMTLEIRWSRMGTLATALDTISRFWPPDISIWAEMGMPVLETIMMALLGTVTSVIISIPVIIMAARNIKIPFKTFFYIVGRFIIIISRSVHELVWALIFVTALGLGAFPGVLALSVRSIGFISKMMAESIENIDENQVEAIEATGANPIQIWIYAIMPQIIPTLIAVLIYRWDVNFRASTILGVVGAGGVGYLLDIAMKTYTYGRATAVIIVIIILVGIGELSSAKLRDKYVKESERG